MICKKPRMPLVYNLKILKSKEEERTIYDTSKGSCVFFDIPTSCIPMIGESYEFNHFFDGNDSLDEESTCISNYVVEDVGRRVQINTRKKNDKKIGALETITVSIRPKEPLNLKS